MSFSQELGENINNLESAFEHEETSVNDQTENDPTDELVPSLLQFDDEDDEVEDEVTVLLF